ncbi:MAG: hypothetical protein MH252_08420 [Thermosynechococcaceae cyanobacterium MS004]|nr:hypothetical protein [Thermosynechococcaceae cyanobacterium MS004]
MGLTITIPGVDFSANGFAPLSGDLAAYLTALAAVPSTITPAKTNALTTLVSALSNGGVLSKLAQVYTFNGSNLAGALVKLRGGADLVVSGDPAPVWSPQGLTLTGTAGTLATGHILPGIAAMSWFCGSNTLTGIAIPVSGGAMSEIGIGPSGQQVQVFLGGGGSSNTILHSDANLLGLWTVTRDSNSSLKLYKGAAQVAENTATITPFASEPIRIGQRPGLSLGVPHLTRFVALWNTSASAADIAVLNTALNAYLAVL